jgi:predicted metallopeptidase
MARKRPKYAYEVAPDVQAMLEEIVSHLSDDFAHVDVRRVVCYRSRGSTARIYARIWALPGIWQHALGVQAHYVIEVVERFDREPTEEKEKTLIHELMHIPKTFSGNLVPHKCFGKNIDCHSVDKLHKHLVASRTVNQRMRLAAPG